MGGTACVTPVRWNRRWLGHGTIWYRAGTDLADLAASYLVGLVRAHGFVDGNKRIGLAALLVFLAVNRRPLHAPPAELYALVMAVATKQVTEGQVATWVQEHIT